MNNPDVEGLGGADVIAVNPPTRESIVAQTGWRFLLQEMHFGPVVGENAPEVVGSDELPQEERVDEGG